MIDDMTTTQREQRFRQALSALNQGHSVESKVTATLSFLDSCRDALGDYTLANPLVEEYVSQVEPAIAKVYTESELNTFIEKLKVFGGKVLLIFSS